jgi:DNA repair exonuclease SbcCD ATPase subunit
MEIYMTTDTNPNGSDTKSNGTINEAQNAFYGLMGGDDAPEEGQADEQPEQENDEGVEQQEAQDDDGSEESESEPEEQRFNVKVAGEDKELTLTELKSLAQQGADYTKKTQQVAEQRKALEAEQKAIEEAKYMRDAYAERLQAMEQLLNAQQPIEDLESLKESDPIGYAVRVAEMSQNKEKLYAIQAERQRIAELQQAEQQQGMQQYLSQQAAVLSESLPEYSDPVKGEALRSDLRKFAKNLGFSDQELSAVRDARHVMALYKAMQYDKLQQSKPQLNKRVNEPPKTIKSGNSNTSVNTDQVKKAMAQLQKSGKVRDAASAFENFI